jgi:hypothetical protein
MTLYGIRKRQVLATFVRDWGSQKREEKGTLRVLPMGFEVRAAYNEGAMRFSMKSAAFCAWAAAIMTSRLSLRILPSQP